MDGFLSHIGEMRDTTRLAANLGPASRNRAGRHARQTMHTAGIPHPIPQNHWNSANPTNRRRHRTSGSVGRQRKNTRNPLASHTMSHRTCSIAPHHITPTPIRAPICIIRRFWKMAHTCMCPHLHIKRLTHKWGHTTTTQNPRNSANPEISSPNTAIAASATIFASND